MHTHGMKKRNLTQLIFWLAVACSLVSAALIVTLGHFAIPAGVASMGFATWAIIRSENKGFLRTSQLRRAYEPARRFTPVQTGSLLALVMVQIATVMYVLIAPSA